MMRRYMLLCLGLCLTFVTLSFTNVGTTFVQAQTVLFSEDFSTFNGSGFSPASAGGQLDSNVWRLLGGQVNGTFGGTHTTAQFAVGTSAGNVTAGGAYAFDAGGGKTVFGVQPSGNFFSGTATITLRIQNTTGSLINDLDVAYTIYERNDQTRSSLLNFRYSTDDTAYTSVVSLNFATGLAASSPVSWVAHPRSTTLTGLNLAPNDYVYLQWIGGDNGGSGSRDEYGISDVTVTTSTGPSTPPTVTTTTPANNATGVAVNSPITINFNQPVTITNAAAFAMICLIGPPIDLPVGFDVSTSGPATSFTLTLHDNLPYDTTCQVNVQTYGIDSPNGSMTADHLITFTTAPDPALACSVPTTPIEDVTTGSVTVKGVVTADYQTVGGTPATLNGFFIQDTGINATKSDGIFVYTGTVARNVSVGDELLITGTGTVYQGQRQLGGALNITNCGTASLPTPTVITLPAPANMSADDFYEQYEGMLVEFAGNLMVSDTFLLGRFNELTLVQGDRPQQFTQIRTDVANAPAYHADLARRTILLDDPYQMQNLIPVSFPTGNLTSTNNVRAGDTISNLTGILTYTWSGNAASGNAWRVRPVDGETYQFNPTNGRANNATPPAVGGDLSIVSYNVLNYFTTLGSRGAATTAELQRQQTKIVNALCELDPTVAGLLEIQNNDTAVTTLVNALNTTCSSNYAFVNSGNLGSDEIKNAIIYQPDIVDVVNFEILSTPAFIPTSNRPMLTVTFEVIDPTNNSYGNQFTVAVNHLKSKGSACGAGDDEDGDLAGSCNGTRTAAATEMVRWLGENPTGATDPYTFILGDLNSYAQEDPLQVLYGAGYQDLGDDYTYSFSGRWGSLDYVLGNADVVPYVTGAGVWHINADEPRTLEYNADRFMTPAVDKTYFLNNMYDSTPFRSSDHDPVIVGVSLPIIGLPEVVDVTDSNGISIDGVTYTDEVDELTIQFNVDVFDDGTGAHADSASNPANYILLAEGSLSGFQTVSCVAGVSADDLEINPVSVSYDALTRVTTLTFSPALENGSYRLLICGTTSIVSATNPNLHLNNGVDSVVNFIVDVATTPTATPVVSATPVASVTPAPTATAVVPGTQPTPAPYQPLQPEELGAIELPATGETPFWAELLRRILGA